MSEYRVTICDRDGELTEDTSLPFVPFPGLLIVPAWSAEYLAVQEVYWNRGAECFEVYCVPAERECAE